MEYSRLKRALSELDIELAIIDLVALGADTLTELQADIFVPLAETENSVGVVSAVGTHNLLEVIRLTSAVLAKLDALNIVG